MAVSIIGPKFYAWDSDTGKPLAFGKVYTYEAGTSTPKPTYTSETGGVVNANPVILNSAGYADIYLIGSYKIVVKDADDVEVWTADPVTDASGLQNEWVNERAATQVSPTSFSLVGNYTDVYQAGKAVKMDDTTIIYGHIDSVQYLTGNTIVEVTADSSLTSDLSRAWVSLLTDNGLPKLDCVIRATSMADMITTTPIAGYQVNIASFHSGIEGGGGTFYFDATKDKALHNGGTIIDPTNTADLATWDAAAKTTWFTAGTGTGCWVRLFDGSLNVLWFGAVRDAVVDDAQSINKAVKLASLLGIGTVYIPGGTYLLGTTDPISTMYYIVPEDNVNIVGEGIDRTILKVKTGENTRFDGTTGPFIIATAQAQPLTNCTFSDITFDWNGANNLLTEFSTRRNNASIFSLNGGINIIVERIKVKETPGNQCVFFPASTDLGQQDITVKDSIFLDSGRGLVGNYSMDHSSIYCNGDRILYENNYFSAGQTIYGAAYEIHGSNSTAVNNVSNNYGQGFWIGSDFKDLENINISGDIHLNVYKAFSLSAPTYAINKVSVNDSIFIQKTGLTVNIDHMFVNGNTIAACDSLRIIGNHFIGQGYAQSFLQHYKIEDLIVEGNTITGFALYGLRTGGVDLGDGFIIRNLKIVDNIFNDVGRAVYFNTLLNIGTIIINNNIHNATAADAKSVITISAPLASGFLGEGVYSPNYSSIFAGNAPGFNSIESKSESGTFVPTIEAQASSGAATYTIQNGSYVVKNGICTVFIELAWSASPDAGSYAILTLPFNSISGSPDVTGSVMYSGFTLPADTAQVTPFITAGGNGALLRESKNTTAGISNSKIPNSGTLTMSISYNI